MTAWVPIVRYLADGENVNDVVTNRPLTDLANRTQHLKEIVDQAAAGEILVVRDASIETGTVVGDWVYFDSNTLQYRKAQSEILVGGSGAYTGPRSFVIGFVASLSSPTVGMIVTDGLFRDAGLIFGALLPGTYYLSDVTAGTVTDIIPAVPIITMVKNANNTIQVNIDTKDLINSSDAAYTLAVTSVATANTNISVIGCEDGNLIPPGPLDPRTKDIVITLPDTVVTDDAADGGLVVKETAGVALKRGWVAEKFLAGPGISLSSTHTTVNINPALTTYQGEVTVSASAAVDSADVQVVALDSAREETIRGVINHSFPKLIPSSMRIKIKVPGAPGSGNKQVTLKMWVTGTVAAAVPVLATAYHILTPPDGLIVGPIVAGDTASTPVAMQTIATALEYFDAEMAAITAPAGSIIHISLTRAGNTDAYGGDVAILYMTTDIA